MFVHRDPAASSGLGPGRPDELRMDYQIIRLLTNRVSAPAKSQRQREGRVSPPAQAQAEEGPQRACLLVVLVSHYFPLLPCATVVMAPRLLPDWLRDRWLLLGEYWVG